MRSPAPARRHVLRIIMKNNGKILLYLNYFFFVVSRHYNRRQKKVRPRTPRDESCVVHRFFAVARRCAEPDFLTFGKKLHFRLHTFCATLSSLDRLSLRIHHGGWGGEQFLCRRLYPRSLNRIGVFVSFLQKEYKKIVEK